MLQPMAEQSLKRPCLVQLPQNKPFH
jgi:hypothetical protein